MVATVGWLDFSASSLKLSSLPHSLPPSLPSALRVNQTRKYVRNRQQWSRNKEKDARLSATMGAMEPTGSHQHPKGCLWALAGDRSNVRMTNWCLCSVWNCASATLFFDTSGVFHSRQCSSTLEHQNQTCLSAFMSRRSACWCFSFFWSSTR